MLRYSVNNEVGSALSLTTIALCDTLSPPDGGYGWVVVLAAFCNNMIADGLTFSFGIIFLEILNIWDETHFKTSLITSLFNGIPLLFGPITSMLIEKYSSRNVAICGGFITHVGFFLSFFATTFITTFITLSIIAPIGLSCMYISSIVMVSHYFDKIRATATGFNLISKYILYFNRNCGFRLRCWGNSIWSFN